MKLWPKKRDAGVIRWAVPMMEAEKPKLTFAWPNALLIAIGCTMLGFGLGVELGKENVYSAYEKALNARDAEIDQLQFELRRREAEAALRAEWEGSI